MGKSGIFNANSAFYSTCLFLAGLVPTTVYAQLNGSFSGAADQSLFQCVIPSGSVQTLGTHNITFSASSNSVSISISGPDFTYSGSGTVIEISPNNFSGPVSTSSFTVNSSLTGGLDSELGNAVVATTDSSGNLTSIGFGFDGLSTSGGICDEYVFSFVKATIISPPTPPSGPPGSSNEQVNPEETPGSRLTTPQVMKSQVRAITSDLQQRINDVFRTIKLARKHGAVDTLPPSRMPPGRVPRDQRDDESEDEDTQASLPVQRTRSGFMLNTLTGMNAGDNTYLIGAWASYSYTDFDNEFAATAFDGNRHGGLAGIDISPWDSVLLGLAVGYEDNSIDTDFNRGEQETDGFTIAPYFGYVFTDTWSVDFSFGYSNLDTDQFRTLPGTTTLVTSSPDHDRWFGMLNLNGLTVYGNWIIGGKIGLLYAKDVQDTYVESDGTTVAEFESELGQWNIGADVAYSYGEFEPFARVLYENDFSQTEVGVIGGAQPSFDDDDVLLGFGIRYFGMNNLTGNLEFNTRLGREDYDEYDISATLRYEW